MKRLTCCFLTALLCLLLCACGNDTEAPGIVGTWEGSGTVSIIGENAPAQTEITERWTFRDDGTVTAEISAPETTLPPMEYTYVLDCGILLLTANGRSVQASYDVKVGNVLELKFGERTLKVEVLVVADNVGKGDAAAMYKEVL